MALNSRDVVESQRKLNELGLTPTDYLATIGINIEGAETNMSLIDNQVKANNNNEAQEVAEYDEVLEANEEYTTAQEAEDYEEEAQATPEITSIAEFLFDDKAKMDYAPDITQGVTSYDCIESTMTDEGFNEPDSINWVRNVFEGISVRGILFEDQVLVPMIEIMNVLRIPGKEIKKDIETLTNPANDYLVPTADWLNPPGFNLIVLTPTGILKMLDIYQAQMPELTPLIRKFGRWITEVAKKPMGRAARVLMIVQAKMPETVALKEATKDMIIKEERKRTKGRDMEELDEERYERLRNAKARTDIWEMEHKPRYKLPEDGILRWKDGRPVPLITKGDRQYYVYRKVDVECPIIDGYISVPTYRDISPTEAYAGLEPQVDGYYYIRPDRYYGLRLRVDTCTTKGAVYRKLVYATRIGYRSVERQYTRTSWKQKQKLIEKVTMPIHQTAGGNKLIGHLLRTFRDTSLLTAYHIQLRAKAEAQAKARIEAGEPNAKPKHVNTIGAQEVAQVVDLMLSYYIEQAHADPKIQNSMFDYTQKGKNVAADGTPIRQYLKGWNRYHKHVIFDIMEVAYTIYPSDVYPEITRTRFMENVKLVLKYLTSPTCATPLFDEKTNVIITDPDALEKMGYTPATKQDYRRKSKRENPDQTQVACVFIADLKDDVIDSIEQEAKLSPLEIGIEVYQMKPGRIQQASGNRYAMARQIELHHNCDKEWQTWGHKQGDKMRISTARLIGLLGGESLAEYKVRVKHATVSGYFRYYITNAIKSNPLYRLIPEYETLPSGHTRKNYNEVEIQILVARPDRIPIKERLRLDEAA